MLGKKRLIEIAFIFVLVILLSAFRTVTARADDATPPPTATPEVTQPSDSGSTVGTQVAPTNAATPSPTDVSVTQPADTSTPVDTSTATPVPTDVTVTQAADTSTPVDTSTSTPDPTQVASDAGTTATDATTTLLSQLPQGSQLVLQSGNQPAIPLGSVEAANIIKDGDPIWCPTGVTPKDNVGGCTHSFSVFNGGLLTELSGKLTSGTIWIESTYDNTSSESGPVTLDGSLGSTVNFALTLQGGWSGALGTTTITTTNSTFNVPLTIDWNADVTLKNITVTNVSSGSALAVLTPKNITLTGVKVINTSGSTGFTGGAVLSNESGTGNITVTSSQFNNNSGGDGLDAYSNGTITVSNVSADNNGGYGADLENQTASSPKTVTMTSGPYEFNGNGETGLNVISKGAIALKDIDALDNGTDGADLNNCLMGTSSCTNGSGNITLTGSNVFAENGAIGLWAYSNGAISANNVVANGNGSWGAELINAYSTSVQPVTLTGSSNQFKSNYAGLDIYSRGNITLNSITASYNYGDTGSGWPSGAELDDCVYDSVTTHKCTGTGNVTLTGTNTFDQNYRAGLMAWSGGTITISNLLADGNGNGAQTADSYGALLSNLFAKAPKGITLTGMNTFNDNYADGLYVQSLGPITVSNVTANNGQTGNGAYLDNQWVGASGALTLGGVNTFNKNGGDGLEAYSSGTISLNSLDAENNGGYGALVNNQFASTAQPVKLTGTNTFNSNVLTGLYVTSKGSLTLNSLQASWNCGAGVYLDNTFASLPQTVSLTGTNGFYGNNADGLFVHSNGAVTLNNLNAGSNGQSNQDPTVDTAPYGGYGVYVVNDITPSSHQSVTLTGTNMFGYNWFGGLAVDSYGTITTNGLSAYDNGQGGFGSLPAGVDGLGGYADWADGVYLNNCLYASLACSNPASEAISVKGNNWFDNNKGSGLMVFSTGAITSNNLEASSNSGGWGVGVNNAYPGVSAGITLTGFVETSGNAYDGLSAESYGAIATNNVSSSGNGSGCPGTNCYGAYLSNSGAASALAVSMLGSNYLDNNAFGGLYIESKGAITLNNVIAGDSASGFGASLNNTFGTAVSNVTITGTSNRFDNNNADGLDIVTRGSITLNNISADGNGTSGTGNGAVLDNTTASSPQLVTMNGNNWFGGNASDGLDIHSKGVISVNNLDAENNGKTGASINNAFSHTSPQNVSLTGLNQLGWNGDSGLVITTYGTIAVNNLTANYNGTNHGVYGWGAVLDNCGYNGSVCTSTLAKSITLTGVNVFNGNYQDGLWATSEGPIQINALTANDNTGNGAYLDNQWDAYSSGGITLTGSNVFSGNHFDGLRAYSRGAITASNLTANNNNGDGAYLNATNPTKAQNVTLTGTNVFLNNGDTVAHTGDGLEVYANGNITTNNVTASGNAWQGAVLDNCLWNSTMCLGSGTMTLTGTNTFNNNYSDGLWFDSHKSVTVSSVTADENCGIGVNGSADGTITLLGGSMTGNTSYGWQFNYAPTITLKGVFAYGNNGGAGDTNLLGGGTLIIVRTYP